MEVEGRWFLQPATKEAQEVQEAAAALLDLKGLERTGMFEPRSLADLHCLGVDCRRRGTELVIRWDGDRKLQGLMEIDAGIMANLRSRADAARFPGVGDQSVGLQVSKYVGIVGCGVRYMSKEEFKNLMDFGAQNPGPLRLLRRQN